MIKLIEFISSFENLNLKELIFKELHLLSVLVGVLMLVILLKWLINSKSRRRPCLGVSSLAFFERKRLFLRRLPEILFIFGTLFLIAALLNPVLPLIKNKKNIEAKEIMIILDFSETMTHKWGEYDYERIENEEDLTKLDIEKKYVIKFVKSRRNDAVGLIVYSKNAYLTSPLTRDHQSLISLIKLFKVNYNDMAGWSTIIPNEIYTATGDALFLADEYLKKYGKSKEKIIVLFTDGRTNMGSDPIDALRKISGSGFKVFLLGVDFNAEHLAEDVKNITGGEYFSVGTEEEFQEAVSFIDRWTGKNKMTVDEYIVDRPQYFYFAFIALVIFIFVLFLKNLHYFRDLL